jgi:hypothetical protein
MSTAEVDPLHTQWALAPWDPESISFGPFRNSTFRQSAWFAQRTIKLSPFSPSPSSFTLCHFLISGTSIRFTFVLHLVSTMTPHFLCLHSIRTQPPTREANVLPILPFPSRRLVVFFLLLFLLSFQPIFRYLTVFNTRSCVTPPSLRLYSILYPPL